MKTLSRLLALSLLTVCTTVAQTVVDDFSSATNWNVMSAPYQQGTSSLTISVGQANFLSTIPVANNSSSLIWNVANLPYATSWEAQVDVHARTVSSSPTNETISNTNYYFYGSLGVTSNTSWGGGPPNMMSADFMRPGGLTQSFQATYYLLGQRRENPANQLGLPYPATAVNATTDATLHLAFDASTKKLRAYYDLNHGVGGWPSWSQTGVIDLDADMDSITAGIQNWGMTDGDTFTLGLSATSGSNIYGPGDVYFDNFSVTVVPEPSTYAAFVGLGVLGCAAYCRRNRQLGKGA